MPILETLAALIGALIAFWKSLTPEQQRVIIDIVTQVFDAMFRTYYDWFRGGPEGEPT